jgi:hypothetical protein
VTVPRGLLLAVAVLAAPVAWAGQLVAGYGLGEGGCGAGGARLADLDRVDVVVAVASGALVAAGLLAALAVLATRPRPGAGFLAAGAVYASLVLGGLVVLGGVAALTLDPCAPG